MKLVSITVRNFRSYIAGQNQSSHLLSVGEGLNLLVGPNNCGKSNLLRAVSLALEDVGGSEFDKDRDTPSQLAWAYPVITLEFQCNKKVAAERTLLSKLVEYEKSAGVAKTHAENGKILLRVIYRNAQRDVSFAIRKAGSKKGDLEKLEGALSQFKKCIRFVYLKSGESLGNFLSGAFRELLHTVRRHHLVDEVARALGQREDYMNRLANDLLAPLSEYIHKELQDVMPEIQRISVRPSVPLLEETLAGSEILVQDSAETGLLRKGTGVRGALLVALLGYLVEYSRHSIVLAVEEPESFLHPQAQQELRDDLRLLAERPNVTLLVTTHSPFLLDRSPSTTITAISKDLEGRSVIGDQIHGNESQTPVTSSLFGETITPNVLDLVRPPKAGTKAFLFVEGPTDEFYIEMALKAANKLSLLSGIEIRYDEGAHKAAVLAILARQMIGNEIPVAILLDWDLPGRQARDFLKQRFSWNGRHLFTYRNWKQLEPSETPVEAEDMFAEAFLAKFVSTHPPQILAEKVQYKQGMFHYGFTGEGKDAFMDYVSKNLRESNIGLWIRVVEDIRKSLKLSMPDYSSDAQVQSSASLSATSST